MAKNTASMYLKLQTGEAQKNIKNYRKALREARRELEGAEVGTKEYQAALRKLNRVDGVIKKHNKSVYGMGRAWSQVKSVALGFVGGSAITAGIGLIASAFRGAARTVTEFQDANARLNAVLGTTTEQTKALRDQQIALGSSTAFTAGQAADAQTELAKLGFTMEEITNLTPAVLDLAAASGTELANAASIAGSTLRQFGLDSSETQRVVDVMAKSFSSSALDIEKFSIAMASAGPVAASAGVSLERTTALIGTLADRGLDASTAGTSLRNIFLDIAKAGLTYEEAMDQVRNATDQNVAALDLFGKRGATTAVILAQNSEAAAELETKLNDAAGAAQSMAEKQLDTLTGDVTKLKSAWEGLILSLENGEGVFAKALRGTVQAVTDLIGSLQDTDRVSQQLQETLGLSYWKDGIFSPDLYQKLGDFQIGLNKMQDDITAFGAKGNLDGMLGSLEQMRLIQEVVNTNTEEGVGKYRLLEAEIKKAEKAVADLAMRQTVAEIDLSADDPMSTETDTEDPKVAAVRTQMETIKDIYSQANEEILQLQRDLGQREILSRDGVLTQLTQLDEEYYRRKAERIRSDLQTAQVAANVGINIIGQVADAQGASAKFQQELALFQVIINQGLALSQAAASAKGLTPIDYLLSLGAVVGAVLSQFAQSKSAIDSAGGPPPPPAFRTGTISSPEGVARVGESGEEMVFLPGGSRVLTAGETSGRTGNLFGPSFTGGDFSTGPAPASIGGGGSNDVAALIGEIRQWQRELKVVNVERDRQKFNERRDANRKVLGYRDN